MAEYDISGSIVVYKTPTPMLDRVVASFFGDDGDLKKKLFIIDNDQGSTKLPKRCDQEDCVYIAMDRNAGYGGGHNEGLSLACQQSRYHVILNPDIEFSDGTLASLTRFMDSAEDIIECMPRVTSANGELQYLCKLLPTPLDLIGRRFGFFHSLSQAKNERYELRMSGYDKIMDVPCLSGCFMFFRSTALREHGLAFDERFFMYLEDFDLIRRCNRFGRTVYYPFATVVHDHQRISYKNLKALAIHIRSSIRYFNKYGWFFDEERRLINRRTLNRLLKIV